MNLRSALLQGLNKIFPFSLKGDLEISSEIKGVELSCLINFYGRIDLLSGILFSLSEQYLDKKKFEVILVEDRGGTDEGRAIAEKFKRRLNIRYFVVTENYGILGAARNFGVSMAYGRIILFLDDDTIILQRDFLSTLIREFETLKCNAIIPHGSANYSLLKHKYSYHQAYFPTNRCMAYCRKTLSELHGFVSSIVGQEDVEFVIRFIASGRKFYYSPRLRYYHPPLIVNNLNKSTAVGLSFAGLRKRYPLVVWLMLMANGVRHLPLLAVPFSEKSKMQGRFSLGFIKGIFYWMSGKKTDYK
ncbi:MAG: glycosyltransferase family 2 protein [Nitrospirae bacterium]|nr:glycosyltransferase family 2 protein [Nitrospirota bacterium]MBF0540045.1 glycosyltransferase family 2 protein [Nitrospirota bacterium]